MRASSHRLRASTALTLGALALAGCSLGQPSRDACRSSADCRATFGGGFFCVTDTGLCERALTDACPELFPADAADDPSTIVVGTIFDRASGNQGARERAARLAVAGLNERAGIDGRRVALLHCDTSLASPVALADHLVRVGVPAIIGPSSSSNVEAVFSSHRNSGVLVISPSATATQLENLDSSTPGLLWRTAPPDNLQADVLVAELAELGAATIAIVTRQNDTYAQSLSLLVQSRAMEADITIGRTPQFADAAAIATAAASAVEGSPDRVLFISATVADAAAFLDAAAGSAAYDGVGIVLTDAAANEDLFTLTTAGRARFPQVRATRPAAPSTVITNEFRSAYMAANGGEDPLAFSFTAHTYDATALVLLGAGFALGTDQGLTGAGIAEGIVRTSSSSGEPQGLLAANFLSIIEALRRDPSGANIVGASGPLDYGPDEELLTASYEVLDIDGARFRVLRVRDAM